MGGIAISVNDAIKGCAAMVNIHAGSIDSGSIDGDSIANRTTWSLAPAAV